MKDKAAVEVYGERGKDGVVLVDLLTEEEYQNKQKFPKPAKVRTESESPKKSHFYTVSYTHLTLPTILLV